MTKHASQMTLLLTLTLGAGQAITGKTLVVQPLPTEDIDTVRKVALHDSGKVAIIGEITRGLIAKGSAPQKLSYFSLYDAQGKVIQDFYTDLPGNTSLGGVTFDAAGNSYLLGDATDLPAGIPGNEVFIKQFKPDGKSGWLKILSRQQDSKSDDQAAAVATDDQGNIYALFTSRGNYMNLAQQSGQNAVLVKLDGTGKPLWTRQLGTGGANEAVDVDVTQSGRVIVALNTVEKVRSGWLYTLSADEGKVLTQTETGRGYQIADLALDPSGEVVVVGESKPSDTKNLGGYISRFSAQLKPLWTRYWQAEQGQTALTAAAFAPNGDLYVGGRLDQGQNISLSVQRFGPEMNVLAEIGLDSAGQDNLHSLAVSGKGQVWAGGSVYQAPTWHGWLATLDAGLSKLTPFKLQEITLEPSSKDLATTKRPAAQGLFKP